MLPIEHHLDEIRHHLDQGAQLIIEAPPGAGKTTLVPPALLQAHWLQGRKILMLQPRRLAARATAANGSRPMPRPRRGQQSSGSAKNSRRGAGVSPRVRERAGETL